MNFYEFNSFDDNDAKLATVLSDGECVGCREGDTGNIMLYQLRNFYVEMYSITKLESDLKFRSFTSLEHLQPYLDQIDISSLIIY